MVECVVSCTFALDIRRRIHCGVVLSVYSFSIIHVMIEYNQMMR